MTKWNEEIIINELKKVIKDIGHFPYLKELKLMNKYNLIGAISRNGGFVKFKKLLNYELFINPNNYWTEERTIFELKKIISKINHFPTQPELQKNKKGLPHGINKNGGILKFRKLLGYKFLINPDKYWTEEKIKIELNTLINKLGHFPTYGELKIKGLPYAVDMYGGLKKFRIIFGYKFIRKPNNYWNIENTKEEIKNIIYKLNHFPTIEELIFLKRNDLIHAICKNGGIYKLKKLLGYSVSLSDEYISKFMSYNVNRGKSSEKIVKEILQNYCSIHNLPEPIYNKKLCKGNIIEFVCNTNKTIGIDVTNTKSNKRNINYKWTKKDYHKHLDELWIVVFSNTFIEQDYIKWNTESPDNVKIFSIYNFLKELDYSLDEHTKSKVDKYNSCTFHTKEEFKEKYLEENNISETEHSSYEDKNTLPTK